MLKIVADPNDVLNKPTEKVTKFDRNLQDLIEKMVVQMRAANGIGLAANQVGVSLQVMVIEVNTKRVKIPLHVMINPKILSLTGKVEVQTEGCLSLPKMEVDVPRFEAVKIKGQNAKGKPITIAAKGLFARIIQHEIDHLNGILISSRGKVINER